MTLPQAILMGIGAAQVGQWVVAIITWLWHQIPERNWCSECRSGAEHWHYDKAMTVKR